MDLKKYWPFMVIGYALFSFANVPVLGLALAIIHGKIPITWKRSNALMLFAFKAFSALCKKNVFKGVSHGN